MFENPGYAKDYEVTTDYFSYWEDNGPLYTLRGNTDDTKLCSTSREDEERSGQESLQYCAVQCPIAFLCLFLRVGQKTKQIHQAPVNQRYLDWNKARRGHNNHVHEGGCIESIFKQEPENFFDAGGTRISVMFYEISDYTNDHDTGTALQCMTRVETEDTDGNLNKRLFLSDYHAAPLSGPAFQKLLHIFGLRRAESSHGDPHVHLNELNDFFWLFRDVDLLSQKGLRNFCELMDFKPPEELNYSEQQQGYARVALHKITVVFQALHTTSVGIFDGSHRVGSVSMVSRGIYPPSFGLNQPFCTEKDGEAWKKLVNIPRKSPAFVPCAFDIYQTTFFPCDQKEFAKIIQSYRSLSKSMADAQNRSTEVEIPDVIALVIDRFIDKCGHDLDIKNFMETCASENKEGFKYSQQKLYLCEALEKIFPRYDSIKRLLPRDKETFATNRRESGHSENESVERQLQEIRYVIVNDKKLLGTIRSKNKRRTKDTTACDEIFVLAQLLQNAMLTTSGLRILSKFMLMDNFCSFDREQRQQIDLKSLRNVNWLEEYVVSPLFELASNVLWPRFLRAFIYFKNKRKSNPEPNPGKHSEIYKQITRSKQKVVLSLLNILQKDLLQTITKYGPDFKVSDTWLQRLLE